LGKFEQKNSFRAFGGLIPSMTREQALTALEAAEKGILPQSLHARLCRRIKADAC
jgi:multidrug efflux pump